MSPRPRTVESGRACRRQRCPKCRAWTLVGLDDDSCAGLARVDPAPVPFLAEIAAHLDGRGAYSLMPQAKDHGRGGELFLRSEYHLGDTRWPVLVGHRCTKEGE